MHNETWSNLINEGEHQQSINDRKRIQEIEFNWNIKKGSKKDREKRNTNCREKAFDFIIRRTDADSEKKRKNIENKLFYSL